MRFGQNLTDFKDYGLHFFSDQSVEKPATLRVCLLPVLQIVIVALVVFNRTHRVTPSRLLLSSWLRLFFLFIMIGLVGDKIYAQHSRRVFQFQRFLFCCVLILIINLFYLLNRENFLGLFKCVLLQRWVFELAKILFKLSIV